MGDNLIIYEYNLSTPWDVSTASPTKYSLFSGAVSTSSFFFKHDITKIYTSDYDDGYVYEHDIGEK